MKTPKLTYNVQLNVEVPSRALFKELQSELTPYFIDGTNNTCTHETLRELCADIWAYRTHHSGIQPLLTDTVRDFIISIFRCLCKKRKISDVEIGDVVFYCSTK